MKDKKSPESPNKNTEPNPYDSAKNIMRIGQPRIPVSIECDGDESMEVEMKSLGTTRTIKVPAGNYCNRDVKCRFLYYANHDEELPRCGIDGQALEYETDSALIEKCWACQMACEKGA